jgi:hypothetical protein
MKGRVTMQFTYREFASDGDRFAPTAFDSSIGNRLVVSLPGGGSHEGTLVRATVAKDGMTADLTIDVPEMPAAHGIGGTFGVY